MWRLKLDLKPVIEFTHNEADHTITIDLDEYTHLIERYEWLKCLEEAGVDNTGAYDHACQLWYEKHPEKFD